MLLKPGILLLMEGGSVFLLSLFLYRSTGAAWGTFFLLFLWPDLSMLGYVASVRRGFMLYNLAHNYVLPLALAGTSIYLHRTAWLSFSLIWVAHLGWDRALGYGLKYPTFFKDTHLQRVR
jgi:hypothetical protein